MAFGEINMVVQPQYVSICLLFYIIKEPQDKYLVDGDSDRGINSFTLFEQI